MLDAKTFNARQERRDNERAGKILHAERFEKSAKILDQLHDRRKQEKPIDGSCFKEAGIAMQEIKAKEQRSREREVMQKVKETFYDKVRR